MATSAFTNDIPAGRLIHRVQLWGQDGGRDAAREKTESVLGEVYAAIDLLQGAARYAATQFEERSSHDIIIRYRADVKRGMQVLFRGRRFDVLFPLNVEERNLFLHLLCMEDGAT